MTHHARSLLIALHIVLMAFTLAQTIGLQDVPQATDLVGAPIATGAILCLLQLRHSLAAARGRRPRGWAWSLIAVAALAYLPPVVDRWVWNAEWTVWASILMLLHGRARIVASCGYLPIYLAGWIFEDNGIRAVWYVDTLFITFVAVGPVLQGVGIYAAVILVRTLGDLRTAQSDLAERALRREQLRLSRDVHDFLGQRLSAIALKTDLALRLLPTDRVAALGQADQATNLARDTSRSVRGITNGEIVASLSAELLQATELLQEAGVHVTADVEIAGVSSATDELFATIVREGVTNIVRHSDATTVSITAYHRDGAIHLEIVNDRAGLVAGWDNGLTGLSERMARSGGTLAAGKCGDRFRLTAEVPVIDGPTAACDTSHVK